MPKRHCGNAVTTRRGQCRNGAAVVAHMAIVKRQHGIGRVRTRDINSNQFPFLEVIGPLRSPFKVKWQTIPGVRNDRRTRQISPTRQKLRDCRARRTSILSSSHCRCCQARRVPLSLNAKSCDAPFGPDRRGRWYSCGRRPRALLAEGSKIPQRGQGGV